MKQKHYMVIAGLLAGISLTARGQGPLDPTNPPAPTMKTLQELWDKMEAQQAEISTLKSMVAPQANLSWIITTVDTNGLYECGLGSSLAFGPDGQPAISYLDANLGDYNLKFARFNGSSWSNTIVDTGVGTLLTDGGTSLAFGPDGQPAISYGSGVSSELKLARFNGNTWDIETVYSGAEAGYYPSLAFGGPNRQPTISHYNHTQGILMLTDRLGSFWFHSVVDTNSFGGSLGVGQYTSLVFGPDGYPAISYINDGIANGLMFAQYNGSTWNIFWVYNGADHATSLAFGPDGRPAISYHRYLDQSLGFARYTGSGWQNTLVDEVPSTDVGELSSMAFGPDGQPAIAYSSKALSPHYTLRFASFNGSSWTNNFVDGVGNGGADISLAFSPDGQPAISYRDGINHALKFARKGLFKPAP